MGICEIIRYVNITIGVAAILFAVEMFFRYKVLKKVNESGHWKYRAADWAFTFYIICLFQITAFRFGGIGWNLDNMLHRRTRVNPIPLIALWNWIEKGIWWHLFYNVIGNCIWFVPLGLLFPAIYKEYRDHFARTVFIGFVVSVLIEILQFILCTGVTDIDDIIFNTIGTAVGYFLWDILDKLRDPIKRWVKQREGSFE